MSDPCSSLEVPYLLEELENDVLTLTRSIYANLVERNATEDIDLDSLNELLSILTNNPRNMKDKNVVKRAIAKVFESLGLKLIRKESFEKTLMELQSDKKYIAYIQNIWFENLWYLNQARELMKDLKENGAEWRESCELFQDSESKRRFVDLVSLKLTNAYLPYYVYYLYYRRLKTLRTVNPSALTPERYGARKLWSRGRLSLIDMGSFRLISNELYLYQSLEGQYEMKKYGIAPKNDYLFVDVGAFTGETLAWYAMRAKNFRALEIEAGSAFQVLKENVNRRELMGEYLARINASVTSVKMFVDEKTDLLNTIPKEYLLSNGIFLKSDIEGSERNLLRGSRRLLKEYRPILAISSYHLFDDLKVLPKLIIKTNDEYKLYLGDLVFIVDHTLFAK